MAELWLKGLAEDDKKDLGTVKDKFLARFERKTPTWVECGKSQPKDTRRS